MIIINEAQVTSIYKGCGFTHRLISQSSNAKQKRCKPKEVSIKKVLQCIKMHKIITKKVIVDKIGMSSPTLDNCLDALLETKEVTREFIRMSGPYPVYRYIAAAK